MDLSLRNIISGLEGCGKSSKVFQHLETLATVESPILFGVKNYSLMVEQIQNWSNRFNIPLEQFAICGFNKDYQPALEAYTNKDLPFIIPDTARFVFISQANLQRNKHTLLQSRINAQIQHIVVDEFEFTSGIIPTLDYELSSMRNGCIKERTETEKLKWILANYTKEDLLKIQTKHYYKEKGFTLAHWIDDSRIPITFLSSELLAKDLLITLNFHNIEITSPSYKDCTVNVWSSPLIGREFFNVMNQEVVWDHLPYDLIISDSVNSYFEDKTQGLEITALSHTAVRGSNQYKNNNILTILSYIPSQVLKEIQDSFLYFGNSKDYVDIEKTFYRDRLCQAIGRTLGNRGGTETNVVIHEDIFNKLDKATFPYTFNTSWELELKNKDEILKKIINQRKTRNNKSKPSKNKKAISLTFLDNYFEKDTDSFITSSDLKIYLTKHNIKSLSGKGILPSSKVAKYFNVDLKYKKVEGKTVMCVLGLKVTK